MSAPTIEWTKPPLSLAVSRLAGNVRDVTVASWPGCPRRSVTRIVRQHDCHETVCHGLRYHLDALVASRVVCKSWECCARIIVLDRRRSLSVVLNKKRESGYGRKYKLSTLDFG
jgi:hypothetical protein